MSIAAVEPEALLSWQFMLRTWEELDVPEGCRAEIIEGALILVTPPKPEHSQIVWQVNKALTREILREGSRIGEAEVHQTVDVRVPLRSGLYIPDLLVLPRPVLEYDPENLAAEALLVVEVTSRSTADRDRGPKLWGYAHAGVPLYLLVDRWDPETGRSEVTLFSGPENGRYTSATKVPFGKEIRLPAPFDLTLDTGGFPA
ncbi:Uma2 family endonuclease [Nocardiopsis sp. CT-R113]|uniref:Uma2 family endonuclease n=1 Tax=Nocardiopsis codii TaxID=3065942 RepID=A0ABU7K291_9ACTN|nr:Uma2 family endonuclease [Nocardiopsis sp. CT-R113]MEE2036366.1 Uma2 family endonuclease [Nocardiopsis sp. CT-R113]